MPAFSTHYIFAKELMPVIKSVANFNIIEDAVYIGTQGPDFFYFHKLFPPRIFKTLRSFGKKIHKSKPSQILESMREYTKQHDNDIAKSYVYGFILHYALDRNCHAFVYTMQEELAAQDKTVNPGSEHHAIEMTMDSYMLKKRLKVNEPRKFKSYETINTDPEILIPIGEIYKYVIKNVFDKDISVKAIGEVILGGRKFEEITYDPKGKKTKFFALLGNAIAPLTKNYKLTAFFKPKDLENAKKYGNIDNNVWKNIYTGETSNKSFEDLFEQAKQDALQLINEFQNGKDCYEITKNISFFTGVEVL